MARPDAYADAALPDVEATPRASRFDLR